MIPVTVVIVAALIGLAYVAIPLSRGARPFAGIGTTPAEEAEERKAAALAGIVDLEQEFEIGKLSREDFETLRAGYERDAVAALRELDAASTEDALEREIAAARARLACPSCGAPRTAGGPCPRCGS
ncbi:MAG: hypothetical protein ACRDKT_08210 [Actinomycetota bacterium]